jgi:hypothetical protein
VPIVSISRIQHRRGKRTDLPQLAAGELGWVIDEQRLFIGNGTVADGAPGVGNTEIVTAGSSSFTTALSYVYKGYLGDATPIQTGASGDYSRTLQATLDDRISIKAFGAMGDNSTDDTLAIQRALDEVYSDTDQDDTRARRTLLFPAGIYLTTSALTIPPYAHLVGEGPDKTIISNTGANPVAVTEDDDGQVYGNIGNSGATTPTQIQVSNITFKNTHASGHGGVSIDNATKLYFHNCKFQGTYASGGADISTSKGVTVRSTTALPCANIYFNHCQFTAFARLVDFSHDVTNIRFTDCDFSTAYYGAMLGETMDGSTNGLTIGPRDIQFTGNSWSAISQQAIYVKQSSTTTGIGTRNVISYGNWYAQDVANNFEGVGSIREVPVIQYDNDECSSVMDFFERTDLRESTLNAAPELQGIGITTKAIKTFTMLNNQSSAATIQEFPGLNGKGFSIRYKIERGGNTRTGEMIISSDGTNIAYDDNSIDSATDLGVDLIAALDDKDSTAGNETIKFQYQTTNTGATAVINYQTTILA